MVFGSFLSLTSALSLCSFNGTNCDPNFLDLRPPPIMEYGAANQTILAGSSVVLPCQAIASRDDSSPPKISWLKNGIHVDTEGDSRISQHSGGSLHIAELKTTDTGVYTCKAANEDGESTWTASLNVEEHTNPKAIFFRMPDPSTFPSVPGQPIATNISHDSLDLTWKAPEKNGASPVSGYMLQYYSPEKSQTWYNVHDYVSGTKHRVRNLKPLHSYIFVVRAENEKGIGAPSAPSVPVATKAAPTPARDEKTIPDEQERRLRLTTEQLIKLEEVKTINSTAVRLFWKRKRMDEGLISGYYVKWRGPNNEMPLVNVSGGSSDSVVVNGLLPFTNYEFFVIPYSGKLQGTPSNSMDALTAEAPPSLPPSDVRIRMLNLTTLRISWRAPPADGMNGILKGFQIVIIGKGTKFNRNITTNERAASVTLFHLMPGMIYKVKVAARTSAGIGVSHGTDVIEMTQETLDRHASIYSDEPFLYSLVRRSWFVIGCVILFWFLLMLGCVFFFLKKKRDKSPSSDRNFIKINDGSMAVQPWGEAAYHTTNRMPIGTLHRPITNGIAPHYSMTPNQHDFYNTYQDELNGSLNRASSEPQYHYAQVTGTVGNTMSTFYGNHYQDDPSPYATTTLVTTQNQPAWLSDHMLRGPQLPKNPVPNGPPPRFIEQGTGRRSRSSRGSEYRGGSASAGPQHAGSNSDSPPHTDISYIQSSDGTGSSSNGRSKMNTLSGERRRSPPKQSLMDLIPPPPPGAPPPPAGDAYHGANGSLGFDEHKGARPTSRNRNTSRLQRGNREDESQRSSLMDDEKGRGGGGADSSEADEENSDADYENRGSAGRLPRTLRKD